MSISYFRFVLHHRIGDYLAIPGWIERKHILTGTVHGLYSTVMEWIGEGEPKEPGASR